ncbi:hypothetical protein B566_EDAN019236, partial [Ephemera danica]
MEKRIATFGNGAKLTTEEFHVLNDDAEISMYSREIRWYDYKMQRTSTNQVKDLSEVDILHGPYKRFVAEELVEEGFFYLGTKHGRWERYGREFDNDILKKLQNEDIEGIVIDLRNNGGGSLQEVVDMVGLFIPEGPVVQVKNGDGRSSLLADRDQGK